MVLKRMTPDSSLGHDGGDFRGRNRQEARRSVEPPHRGAPRPPPAHKRHARALFSDRDFRIRDIALSLDELDLLVDPRFGMRGSMLIRRESPAGQVGHGEPLAILAAHRNCG
jgi:hypothetical protein